MATRLVRVVLGEIQMITQVSLRVTRFRDPTMRRAYEHFRETPPRIGPLGEAYRKGFEGIRAQWPRGSLCYAAWAAGRDKGRAGGLLRQGLASYATLRPCSFASPERQGGTQERNTD